jgi:hypothetical protein
LTIMFRWLDDVGLHIDLPTVRGEYPGLMTFDHWSSRSSRSPKGPAEIVKETLGKALGIPEGRKGRAASARKTLRNSYVL